MSEPKNKNLIGIFDSGLGGLSVLKHILKILPNYNYFYLGDRARVPYGEKSPDTIYLYTRQAIDYLFAAGCQLIIIACNTASAQALRRLQQEYLPSAWPQGRLLGVIRPLAEYVAYRSLNISPTSLSPEPSSRRLKRRPQKIVKTVGIIGTKAAIRSGAYRTELLKLNPHLKILTASTPLLVPLIEESWTKKPETKMILKKYLKPFKDQAVDLLLPACTHYSWLIKDIRRIMGKKTEVPEPGEIIAASLKDYLSRHPELDLKTVKNPDRRYGLTATDPDFFRLASNFLGQKLNNLTVINLDKTNHQ